MKPAVQKSPIQSSRIFVVKELKEKYFDPTWHAHNEYQLFLVLKGTGTRFIGNTVQSFRDGDITFLGPRVPHLWRSDPVYFDKTNKQRVHGLVIYFKEDFISDLLNKEEMLRINLLFKKAKKGIVYYGQTAVQGVSLMMDIMAAQGVESLVQLLRILNTLATTKEYKLLHNADYIYTLKEPETRRINLVYNYAAQHFHTTITLPEVAGLLHMTPTSFSRYFKAKTGKSFSDFLSELRVKHACKQLSEDERKTISQVCYECGFNTLSNFNRQFKASLKISPKTYRQKFATL